jgi:hypothetical protein
MTRDEQERFIDRELRGLWPQWDPTDAELRVWTADLAPLPYGLARTAAQTCFRRQATNYQRPVVARFLEQVRLLRKTATTAARRTGDPTTHVYIECLDPPADRPQLAGCRKPVFTARQDDPDHVRACAASMARQFGDLYGGHWITVTTRPRPDDGLRGPAAAARASELILAGPDTRARRFVEGILRNRTQPTQPTPPERTTPDRRLVSPYAPQSSKDPVRLGAVLTNPSTPHPWLTNIPIALNGSRSRDQPLPGTSHEDGPP